jgi:hypothetical protein
MTHLVVLGVDNRDDAERLFGHEELVEALQF